MYKVIYRTTRESKSVPFFRRPDAITNLILEEKRNGRLVIEYLNFSEDYLVKKYVAIWRDKTSLENFNQLEEVKDYIQRKRNYDQLNGNVTNIIGEELNE